MITTGKKVRTAAALDTLTRGVRASFLLLLCGSVGALSFQRFERAYSVGPASRLSISNVHGDISITGAEGGRVTVSASHGSGVKIDDRSDQDGVSIEVRPGLPPGRADFDARVPRNTAVSLSNVMGRITVKRLSGHINISSIEGEVRLVGLNCPSAEIKVTTGDIFFDGELSGDGPYNLQSMNGNIDVRLPGDTAFNLTARALTENINLGDFLSQMTGTNRTSRLISGSHLGLGPKLTLTTYNGRILLHKK